MNELIKLESINCWAGSLGIMVCDETGAPILEESKSWEKVVCHDCLGPMTYKTGVKVERNNFGIPHFVWVCKTCKKNYD